MTADYFATMGIRIVDGRGFRTSDQDGAAPVAVVNETFVRQLPRHGVAIGQLLKAPDDDSPPPQIVGVVADTRTEKLSEYRRRRSTCRSGSTVRSRSISCSGPPAILVPLRQASAASCALSIRRQPLSI